MSVRTWWDRALGAARGRSATQVSDDNFVGFDKYRKHGAYHWQEMDTSPDYRGKIEFIAGFVTPAMNVLDVGCGDGAYMFHISQSAATVVGIDADEDAIRLAQRELARRDVTNARCYHLPLSQLSLDSVAAATPFDLAYSMDVIEHLPQPDQLGERLARVVKPGALILIGTPKYLGDGLVSPYHVREYTIDELRSELAWMDLDSIEHLPMRRSDNVVHDDGFLMAVGRAR